jgi:hyperosmotically inducible periplasmic protein
MRMLSRFALAAMLAVPAVMTPVWAMGQSDATPGTAQNNAGQNGGKQHEDPTKNDSQIQQEAQKKLKESKFSGVQARAENGIIHLTGSVKVYADKQDAEKKVEKVKNANSVVNDIQVAAGETSDQQIADKIARQLAYDRVGFGNVYNAITVAVNNGVATLGGNALGPVAKSDALNIAKRTPGVQNVVDKIQVDPPSPFDDQIRVRVARAVYGYPSLNKYAINPANPIRITVVSGHVILSGVVDSKQDKEVAGIQANSVPDVFSVTNNLEVVGSEERR